MIQIDERFLILLVIICEDIKWSKHTRSKRLEILSMYLSS